MAPERVRGLLALGRRWGPTLGTPARHNRPPLLLAECVPGGTSTGPKAACSRTGHRGPAGPVSASLKQPAPWLLKAPWWSGPARAAGSGTRPKAGGSDPWRWCRGGIRCSRCRRLCCCRREGGPAVLLWPAQPDGGGAGAGACLGTSWPGGRTGGPGRPGHHRLGGGGASSGPGAVC